jgi:hypothetical protein
VVVVFMVALTLETLVILVDQQGQYMAVAVAVVVYRAVQAQVGKMVVLVAVAQFVLFGPAQHAHIPQLVPTMFN